MGGGAHGGLRTLAAPCTRTHTRTHARPLLRQPTKPCTQRCAPDQRGHVGKGRSALVVSTSLEGHDVVPPLLRAGRRQGGGWLGGWVGGRATVEEGRTTAAPTLLDRSSGDLFSLPTCSSLASAPDASITNHTHTQRTCTSMRMMRSMPLQMKMPPNSLASSCGGRPGVGGWAGGGAGGWVLGWVGGGGVGVCGGGGEAGKAADGGAGGGGVSANPHHTHAHTRARNKRTHVCKGARTLRATSSVRLRLRR